MKSKSPVINPRHLLIFVVVALVWLSSQPVSAGAWAQNKGSYYAKLTFIYLNAQRRFDFDGSAQMAPFSDLAAYLYLEYGVLRRTTVIFSAPMAKQSRVENPTFIGKTGALFAGDFEFYVKHQFTQGPIVVSGLLGTKIPVTYKSIDLPPLGTGARDYDVKILLGTSLYPIPAYATADFGYRIRGQAFENEFNFSFEFGYTLREKHLIRVFGNGIRSVGKGEVMMQDLQFAHQQDQTRLGGGLIYIVSPRMELDISFLRTISGRSIPQANEIYLGIAVKG